MRLSERQLNAPMPPNLVRVDEFRMMQHRVREAERELKVSQFTMAQTNENNAFLRRFFVCGCF